MRRIAIIGGTGFGAALVTGKPETQETVYGTASLTRADLGDERELLFLARHGAGHRLPPHRINHRANIAALRDLGADAVFATAAVGSLRREIAPGDFIVLDDFLDFTKGEVVTFFGEPGEVHHTDFVHPYDPGLRQTLLAAADPELLPRIHPRGTYLCVSGPRYETPAEVRLFAQWGADVVGMTGAPEAILCREAGLRYAGVALATNYGTGLLTDAPLSHAEVEEQMATRRDALAAWLLRAARLVCIVFAFLMLWAFAACRDCAADPMPTDSVLFGPGHKQPQVESLRAGPIRVKFVDGQLHYLTVGSKEIIRRIYFAVRESNWDTPPPEFTQITVQKRPDGFSIHLQAVCRSAKAAYHWHGEIVGTANGRITFTAGGAADEDFASPRIGLCVLYGADSLAGQAFQTTSAAGGVTASAFPRLVSSPLVATDFDILRYTTKGMRVTTSISGTRFNMEDQRNYGDSSYKAYSALTYAYPKIVKGEAAEEVVTVQVDNAHDAQIANGPVRVQIGGIVPGRWMPRLGPTPPGAQEADFVGLNGNRSRAFGSASITWSLCPSVHLPDDDNLLDNVTTVQDQLQTARSFAPNASFHIAPVSLDRAHRGAQPDPRYQGRFAAVWTAAVIKYLALGGAADAGFDTSNGPAAAVVQSMNAYAGRPLLAATAKTAGRSPIEALAVQDGGKPVVWLINLTDQSQAAVVENGPTGRRFTTQLQPFEVRRLRAAKK